MSDPYVRKVDAIDDVDERPVYIGVDYDAVRINDHLLNRAQCEEFARAFVAACWEAADNARLMAEEAAE